ncbi:serine hydrolase domain-containing protein [Halostella sp. PRR32]|uniref:serine hydrolase domain-containing protein n=1 Tax=Halostella sp. PRR32 TaxID=3098147 RepID=UPI002B1D939C|nr:serine hydrolase domain-containing protein [Halostella sp. PRR32]
MSLQPSETEQVESLLTDWLRRHSIPGASITIFDSDSEQYANGVGVRNLETTKPATPDTLYAMGSVTKPITALAVFQLVENGELSLSDAVNDYVEHFSNVSGPAITVGELLSHTSGMPTTGPDRALINQATKGVPAGVATEEDRVRYLEQASEYRVSDEERFFYNNTGYNVLGRVIEEVAGRSFSTYVDEEIFRPLNMERATFNEDTFSDADEKALGYQITESGATPAPLPFEELLIPSTGLIASTRDIARFMQEMIRGGGDVFEGTTPELVDQMQAEQAIKQTFLDGTKRRYGHGWMRQSLGGDEVVGHGGGISGSTAFAGYLTEAEVGLAIACNASPETHPTDIGLAILALLSGYSRTKVPIFALREKCQAVTGRYESFQNRFTTIVDLADGGISLHTPEQSKEEGIRAFPHHLDPGEHSFYTVTNDGSKRDIEFDLDSDPANMYFRRGRLKRVVR